MRVIEGDCRTVLAGLDADSLDAVVTDPPYHLTSPDKRASSNMENKTWVAPNALQFKRLTTGFMGKAWDGGDVAFDPATWRAVYRVLKPGAHLLAFSGTRTSHRMVCAIEDAGFEIRDTLCWLYGSGFPKSLSVDKAIDRMMGAAREVVGPGMRHNSHCNGSANSVGFQGGVPDITAPATPEAAQWSGWGTALKPSYESICLARKPLGERSVAANVLRHGTGAINVDACRVSHVTVNDGNLADNPHLRSHINGGNGGHIISHEDERRVVTPHQMGRYPANLLHDGSDEVEAAFAAFGEGRARGNVTPTKRKQSEGVLAAHGVRWGVGDQDGPIDGGDTGSASRFFFQAKPDYRCDLCGLLCDGERANIATCNASNAASLFPASESADSAPIVALEPLPHASEDSSRPQTLPVVNAGESSTPCHQPTRCSAPSNAETWPLPKIVRNVKSAASLCDSCATAIAQNLARVRCSLDSRSLPLVGCMPASRARILNQCLALYVERRESTDTILTTESLSTLFGSVLHAIAESTRSESVASSANTECVPTRFHYSSKADKDDRAGSSHPTVKPISLLRWLVKLITPPGGTVLDCFAGSGTTAEAAMLEGFDAILIEKDPASVADIRHRLSRWSGGDMPLFAPVPAPPEDARIEDLFREPESVATLGD